MVKKYVNKFRPYLLELIDTKIDEYTNLISKSYEMNIIRWKKEYDEYLSSYPGDVISNPYNLDISSNYIKEWLNERIEFLDSVWIDGEVYHNIIFQHHTSYWTIATIKDGDNYGYQPLGSNFGLSDKTVFIDSSTGEEYDFSSPVYSDVIIKMEDPTEEEETEEGMSLVDYAYIFIPVSFIIMTVGFVILDWRRNGK